MLTTTTDTPALTGRARQRAIAKTRRCLARRTERCDDNCPGWAVFNGNEIQRCDECFHDALPEARVSDDDVAMLPEAIEALRAERERLAGPRVPVLLTLGSLNYLLCALGSHLYDAAPPHLRRNHAVTDPRGKDGRIEVEDEDGKLAELCGLIDTNAEIEAHLRAAMAQIEVLAAKEG